MLQFIQKSPEEFQEEIVKGVKVLFDDFKDQFEPKEPTELLTRSETAKLLKINLTTLWSWTKSGKLKAYGIGNRVYYKRTEIENSIKEIMH